MPLTPSELLALREIERGLTDMTVVAASKRARLWLHLWALSGLVLGIAGALSGTGAAVVLGAAWVVLASASRWAAAHLVIATSDG